MKIVNLYEKLKSAARRPLKGYEIFESDPELHFLIKLARDWELDADSVREWLNSPVALEKEAVAREYLSIAPDVVKQVETVFGRGQLPGVLVLMPSFGEFDGFARYDLGEHRVILGVDFPDADVNYLKVLTAHELSHVYRDHSPEVWGFLGKPLSKVTRKEYLNANTGQEHLVSEGLATLFSQAIFPDVSPITHHYYEPAEWQWCLDHHDAIDRSLSDAIRTDGDVWSFYSPNRVSPGSPSRTQYYWAAKILSRRLDDVDDPIRALIELHEKPTRYFGEFIGG